MNEQKKSGVTPTTQAQRNDFVGGVMMELRRVTWPTREEWVTATVLTIGLVVGIGLFTWALDQAFGFIMNWIHPANI